MRDFSRLVIVNDILWLDRSQLDKKRVRNKVPLLKRHQRVNKTCVEVSLECKCYFAHQATAHSYKNPRHLSIKQCLLYKNILKDETWECSCLTHLSPRRFPTAVCLPQASCSVFFNAQHAAVLQRIRLPFSGEMPVMPNLLGVFNVCCDY